MSGRPKAQRVSCVIISAYEKLWVLIIVMVTMAATGVLLVGFIAIFLQPVRGTFGE